jgi:hypothetical protein
VAVYRTVAKINFRIERGELLTRPSATLSPSAPSEGERDGVRGFSEISFAFSAAKAVLLVCAMTANCRLAAAFANRIIIAGTNILANGENINASLEVGVPLMTAPLDGEVI